MRTRIVVLLVTATAGVAYWVTRPGPVSIRSPSTFPLAVAQAQLQAGDVWDTGTITLTVPVENISPEPVKVTGWKRPCSCIAITPAEFVIGPGATQAVCVEVSLSALPLDPKRDDPERDFELELVPLSGASVVGDRWVIRARVKSVFNRPPRQIDLGVVPDLAAAATPTTFELESTAPLARLSAKLEPPIARVELRPVTGERRYEVVIEPDFPVQEGTCHARLCVIATLPSGQDLPAVRIPVSVRGVRDVQPDLPRMTLGVISKDERRGGDVVFSSLTGHPFEVAPPSPFRTA